MKKIDVFKFIIFILIIAAAIWAVHHFHILRQLKQLHGWIHASGFVGVAAFIGLYGVAFAFGIPALALTIYAATIFGTFSGLMASSAGAAIGFAITFVLSRHLARDMVEDMLRENRVFKRIENLTEKYGWYMVAILRFIPFIPAEATNYGFGLTKVKFWPYILSSYFAMLPWLFVYIAGTDAILDFREDRTISWSLVIPTIITVLVLVFAGIQFMRLIEPELRKKD